MDRIAKIDWKWVPKDPEPGFNPEHNRQVVEKTIKANDRLRAKKQKEFKGKVDERANALASWLLSQHGAQSSVPLEKYFGRVYFAKLRGEEIRQELMDGLAIANRQG